MAPANTSKEEDSGRNISKNLNNKYARTAAGNGGNTNLLGSKGT